MKLINAKYGVDVETFIPTLTITVQHNMETVRDAEDLQEHDEMVKVFGQKYIDLVKEAAKLAMGTK